MFTCPLVGAEPDDIGALRREAWAAIRAQIQPSIGREDNGIQAICFLRWLGKIWVTPFELISQAHAYVQKADEIGIDYDYIACFDTSDPKHPFLIREKLGGAFAVTAGANAFTSISASIPTPMPVLEQLARLRKIVELHDAFWRQILSSNPADPSVAFWMARQWGPWIARWQEIEGSGALHDENTIRAAVDEAAQGLSGLRERAAARGIPVPDIGSSRLGFIRQGDRMRYDDDLEIDLPAWDSQLDPRHQSSLRTSGESVMSPWIGRGGGHGGGGGGHGGMRPGGMRGGGIRHGGMHHGGGRRPRRRQFFGGNWGGWNGWNGWDDGWWGQPWYWPRWPWYGWSGWPGPFQYPIQYPAAPMYPTPAHLAGASDEDDQVVSGRRGSWGRRGSSFNGWGGAYGGPVWPPYLYDPGYPASYPGDGYGMRPLVGGSPDNELLALLPILAPGRGGLTCCMDLGPDLQLRVSICVDGRCYNAAADLSDVLGRIAHEVAASHAVAPVPPAASPAAVSDVSAKADDAIHTAGMMLVGALYDQHFNEMIGGWWDGFKKVALFSVAPVLAFHKELAPTLQQYKGPISLAAAGVATAYGGPAGGAAAAQLTGPLIDALADGDAGRLVDGIQLQAGADPTVQKALADAQKAVAHTTAAYHLTATAANAAAGNTTAATKVAELEAAASRGDVAAQQAMQIIAQAFAQASANQVQPSQAQKASVIASGSLSQAQKRELRKEGSAAAMALREQGGGIILGYVKTRGGGRVNRGSGLVVTLTDNEEVQSFRSIDEADDWFGAIDDRACLYAAYYDATDPTWPTPLNERFGLQPSTVTASAGFLPWLALGAAGGGAYAWWRHHQAKKAAIAAPPSVATTSGGAGILPLLAFGAAGAAGWYGRGWWQQRKAAEAAALAAAQTSAPPALPAPPGTTTSGWWW